jgi:hypothetical protein
LLADTGPHLASLYATSKITSCHGFGCQPAASAFFSKLAGLDTVVCLLGIGLILAAPAITGIFWGAPLIARELETRTFNLAWTQSTTRTRWLAVKVTLTGLDAMAVTESLGLSYAWWADPISKAIRLGNVGGPSCSARLGPVQLGELRQRRHHPTRLRGVRLRAGNRSRRPHPPYRARHGHHPGHLRRRPARHAAVGPPAPRPVQPHDRRDLPRGPGLRQPHRRRRPRPPQRWILSSQAVNSAGQPVSTIPAACNNANPSGQKGGTTAITPAQCTQSRGYREAIGYLPTSRYWPLQGIETGIFLALALALTWFSFWRLGRRRT